MLNRLHIDESICAKRDVAAILTRVKRLGTDVVIRPSQ